MAFAQSNRIVAAMVVLIAALLFQPPVSAQTAQKCCCQQCGEPCQEYDITCCTVMVPKMVAVTRMEKYVVYEKKEREEKYTVFARVPVTREYSKKCCYLENEIKTIEVIKEKCHVLDVPVTRTRKVKVPVETVMDVTVTTQGKDKCGNPVCVDEIKTCNVIVEKEEERIEECCEKQLVIETTKNLLDYCVMTPKEQEIPCAVDETFELKPVERTRTVYACVPRLEERPVTRLVCKMVPEEQKCCPHCACGSAKK